MRMHHHSIYSLPFSLDSFFCHDSGTKEVRTVSLWILDKQDELLIHKYVHKKIIHSIRLLGGNEQ